MKIKKISSIKRFPSFLVTFALMLVIFSVLGIKEAHAAPLTGANADFTQIASSTSSSYIDEATDGGNATINDVKLCGSQTGEALYLGMPYVFDQIVAKYSTACGGGHVGVWEYYNGSAWASLTVTDNTNGFEAVAGTYDIDITVPSDWAVVDPDTGGGVTTSAYFVRFRTTTALAAQVVGGDQFSAQEFNVKMQVQDELGTALTGLTTSAFSITNGTDTTKYSFREIGSGAYELALDTNGADVTFDYSVTKDGYATSTPASTGALTTALTDVTGTPASLDFSYLITNIATESVTASITSSVTGLTVGDDTAESTCTASGGSWYCPVVLANSNGTLTSTVTLDGYVTKNYSLTTGTTRTASSTAKISDTITGVQYANKVTVTTASAGTALSSATVTVGDSLGTSCAESGSTGVYYCATPVADTALGTSVVKTAFTTNTNNSFASDRTSATDAQVALSISDITYASISSVSVAQVTTLGTGSLTVTWGSSIDTGGFSSYEVYYRTQSGVTNANGTVWSSNNDSALTTRTTTSTTITGLQKGHRYYLVVYALDANGNRSVVSTEVSKNIAGDGAVALVPQVGGGAVSVVTPTQPTTEQTYSPITEELVVTPAEVTKETVEAIATATLPKAKQPRAPASLSSILSDAALLFSGVGASIRTHVGRLRDASLERTYETTLLKTITTHFSLNETVLTYVTYGTPATRFLGAGERAGVLNSFVTAFGRTPRTTTDWEDIVKLGNGRWPTQRNALREVVADENFRAVYFRAPDRTNARDDAAIMMLAYGLRPIDRDVAKEETAIQTYRDIFGKNPSSAIAWDAVRAIAYSGAVQ